MHANNFVSHINMVFEPKQTGVAFRFVMWAFASVIVDSNLNLKIPNRKNI